MKRSNLFIFPFMILSLSGLSAYTFLTPGQLRWPSTVISVFYKINPGFTQFTGDEMKSIEAIRKGANNWLYAGKSKLLISDDGYTSVNSGTGYNAINCSTASPQTTISVFARSIPDPDCTASACTVIWHCTGKEELLNVHIQFNDYDFSWSVAGDNGTENLAAVAAHSFGHALGLSHCLPGELASDCASRSGNDPAPVAVMYKFPLVSNLIVDDINGVQALYGPLAVQLVPHPRAADLGPPTPFLEKEQNAIDSNYDGAASYGQGTVKAWKRSTRNARRLMFSRPLTDDEITEKANADTMGKTFTMPVEKTLQQVLAEQTQKADEFIAAVVSTDMFSRRTDDQVIALRIKFTLLLATAQTMREYNDGLPVEILDMIESKYRMARTKVDEELRRRGKL